MSPSQAVGLALAPEIADLRHQFISIRSDASELVSGLKESQFNWRPNPQSWSMAECLLHLNMVGERYAKELEKVLEDPRVRARTGRGPFEHGPFARWMLAGTEPPPKSKSKAPRSFRPAYGQPLNAVMPTFFHLQDRLVRLVEQSDGLHLHKIRVPAPGMGPVRFNLHSTFSWIAAHERRHLWQARQVRQQPAFPSLP
jgi:hypothetical protein